MSYHTHANHYTNDVVLVVLGGKIIAVFLDNSNIFIIFSYTFFFYAAKFIRSCRNNVGEVDTHKMYPICKAVKL